MEYRIIKRRDDARERDGNGHDSVITESRDYNFPLCGFCSYKQPIKIGDIIGIMVEKNTLVESDDEGYPWVKINLHN